MAAVEVLAGPGTARAVLKYLSVVGYLAMAGGIVVLLAARSLFSSSPVVIFMQVAAVLLHVCARATFGRRSFHASANPTEGGLITRGPYRFIRHPIYTAVCVFAWTGVAANQSWTSGLCGVVILGGAVMRMTCEESLVAARYPEYAEYKARTWRMIPYHY